MGLIVERMQSNLSGGTRRTRRYRATCLEEQVLVRNLERFYFCREMVLTVIGEILVAATLLGASLRRKATPAESARPLGDENSYHFCLSLGDAGRPDTAYVYVSTIVCEREESFTEVYESLYSWCTSSFVTSSTTDPSERYTVDPSPRYTGAALVSAKDGGVGGKSVSSWGDEPRRDLEPRVWIRIERV